MIGHTSRYAGLPKLTHVRDDGRTITYVARRIIPERGRDAMMLEVRVEEGDRLDNVAAATLGDPELFWQICDANGVLNPALLLSEIGGIVKVPTPGQRRR